MMIDRKINDVKINKGWYESEIKSKNKNGKWREIITVKKS